MNPTACAYLAVLAFVAGFLVSRSLKPETEKPEALPSEPVHSSPSLDGRALRFLASAALSAKLRNGSRLRDASDFQEWLLELAEESDKVAA